MRRTPEGECSTYIRNIGNRLPAKQWHIPKERNPQTNGCENLKTFMFVDI